MTERAATKDRPRLAHGAPSLGPSSPDPCGWVRTLYRDAGGVERIVVELTTFVREEDWSVILGAAQTVSGDACLLVTDPLRDLDLTWDEGRRYLEVSTQLWNGGWFDPYSISDVRGSAGRVTLAGFSRARVAPDALPAFETEALSWLAGDRADPGFASMDLVPPHVRFEGGSRLAEGVQRAPYVFVSPWRVEEVRNALSAAGFVKVEYMAPGQDGLIDDSVDSGAS